MLDDALLRTGRFDRLIYVGPPDAAARLEIFKVHTRRMPLDGVSLERLAEETEGFVGSDIASLCKEAGMQAIRESPQARKVTMVHFEAAMKGAHASATPELLRFYEDFGRYIAAKDRIKKTDKGPHEGIYR
jgi:transitional endoplasmic reticulum ATPase